MQSKEIQTTKTKNNISSTENTLDDMNLPNTSQSESMTQIQRDSVITNQDLPYKRVIYGFTLVILTAFLYVVGIYYGIINP